MIVFMAISPLQRIRTIFFLARDRSEEIGCSRWARCVLQHHHPSTSGTPRKQASPSARTPRRLAAIPLKALLQRETILALSGAQWDASPRGCNGQFEIAGF